MSPRILPVAAILALLSSASCSSDLSPIAPTDLMNTNNDIVTEALRSWSPYVGIHPTGEAFEAYREVIPRMIEAGTLEGIRFGVLDKETSNRDWVKDLLQSFNLDNLVLIDNCTLLDPQLEKRIDEVMSLYRADQIQIGNEVTSIPYRCNKKNMNLEEYMAIFKRAYAHITANYPGVMLVTQSVAGGGSEELAEMARLGLEEMSPQKIIVAINVYSNVNVNGYTNILSRELRNFRVWITETGITNSDDHISYVISRYPRLRNNLRAERIYWYALWAGEHPPDCRFGLLRNPRHQSPYFESTPLLKILSGERSDNVKKFEC